PRCHRKLLRQQITTAPKASPATTLDHLRSSLSSSSTLRQQSTTTSTVEHFNHHLHRRALQRSPPHPATSINHRNGVLLESVLKHYKLGFLRGRSLSPSPSPPSLSQPLSSHRNEAFQPPTPRSFICTN
ncbi:hypothetical protein PIB30_059245, partial [Stylosanthes scabra]|nr:hypothetical protein [Stylosanthes scabra]